ncbi:hypothetical protein [Streptomyces sp. NPDC005078]|uniref:hypothetical protein n=1 Tax=unclassified Streptomyces TaxID=2593676 RepID=UPI0033AC9001
MNPYEGPVTVERTDGTLVRVWAEFAVAQEHPGRRGPPWTARLTAPGGEALLLKGAVTLILSRTRWPVEVTHTQLSFGPHSANWTKQACPQAARGVSARNAAGACRERARDRQLGFRFAPRFRDLADQRFWRADLPDGEAPAAGTGRWRPGHATRAWPPARARVRIGGRPTVATEEVIRAARDLLPGPARSITSIAKLLGVSPGTLYSHIPDLRELRVGGVPRQLEARTR